MEHANTAPRATQELSCSRRTFISATAIVGALHLLGVRPTLDGIAMAYADDGGNIHFSITVLSREEVPLVAFDVAGGKNTPVAGMTITLTSNFNGASVTAVTDESGCAVANIRALSEEADDNLAESYGAWIHVTASKPGYRTYTETDRLMTSALPGTDGTIKNAIRIPTEPDAGENPLPYFSCLSLDGVDVQYLAQNVGLVPENDMEHVLQLQLEHADYSSAAVPASNDWTFELYADETLVTSGTGTAHGTSVAAELSGIYLDGAHGIVPGCTLSLHFDNSSYKLGGVVTLPLTFFAARQVVPGGLSNDRQISVGQPEVAPADSTQPQGGNMFSWFIRKDDKFSAGVPGLPVEFFADAAANFGLRATLATATFMKYKDGSKVPITPENRWKKFSDMSGSGWIDGFLDGVVGSAQRWSDLSNSTNPDGSDRKMGAAKMTRSLTTTLNFQLQLGAKVDDFTAESWHWHGNVAGLATLALNYVATKQLMVATLPAYFAFDFTALAQLKLLLGCQFDDGFNNLRLDHKLWNNIASPVAGVFLLNVELGVGAGLGVVNIATLGVRGYGNLCLTVNFDTETADPSEYVSTPFPHVTFTGKAGLEAVVQVLMFKKSIKVLQWGPHDIYNNWKKAQMELLADPLGTFPNHRLGTTESEGTVLRAEDLTMVSESALLKSAEFRASLKSHDAGTYLFCGTRNTTGLPEARLVNPYEDAPELITDPTDGLLAAGASSPFGSGYNPLRGVRPSQETLLWENAFSAPRARVVTCPSGTLLLRLCTVEVEADDTAFSVVQGSNGCLFLQADPDADLPKLSVGDAGEIVYPAADGPVVRFILDDAPAAAAAAAADDEGGPAAFATSPMQDLVDFLNAPTTDRIAATTTPVNAASVVRARLCMSALEPNGWSEPVILDFSVPATQQEYLRANAWDVDFHATTGPSGDVYIALCSIVRPTDSTSFEDQFKKQFVTVMRVDHFSLKVAEVQTNVLSLKDDEVCWHPRVAVHSAGGLDVLNLFFYRQQADDTPVLRRFSWTVDTETGTWTKAAGTQTATLPTGFMAAHLAEGSFDVTALSLDGTSEESYFAFSWNCPAVSPEDGGEAILGAHDAYSVVWAADQYYAMPLTGACKELPKVDFMAHGPVTCENGSGTVNYLYSTDTATDSLAVPERALHRLRMTLTPGGATFADTWPVGHLRTGLRFFSNADGTHLYAARAMEGYLPQLPEDALEAVENGAVLFGSRGKFNSAASAYETGDVTDREVQQYQLLSARYDAESDTYHDFFPLAELSFAPDTLLEANRNGSNRYDFVIGTITDADANLMDMYHVAVPRTAGLQLEGAAPLTHFALPGEHARFQVLVSNTGNVPLKGFTMNLVNAATGAAVQTVTLTDLADALQTDEDMMRPVYDESGAPTDEFALAVDASDQAGLLWPSKTRAYHVDFTVPDDAPAGTLELAVRVSDPVVDTDFTAGNAVFGESLVECTDPRARRVTTSVGVDGMVEPARVTSDYRFNAPPVGPVVPPTSDPVSLAGAAGLMALSAATAFLAKRFREADEGFQEDANQ